MRLEGWETRLDAVIEGARTRGYQLGRHDCFRLACSVVCALTGVDRWPEFAASYATRREALRVIAAWGSSFEAAFDRFFGSPSVPILAARRGDVACYAEAAGELHLGVVLGAHVAVLTPEGLGFVDLAQCRCAWRVG